MDLLLEVRVRDIHDMKEQVCLARLIEGALETVHQIRRQLADESHRIRQQEGQIVDDHLTDGSIEGGKELVLSKHLTL